VDINEEVYFMPTINNIRSILFRIPSHPLIPLLVTGILLRYALGLYTSWSPDVGTWYTLAMNVIYGNGVYDRVGFSYPPVWGYIVGGITKIASLFVDPQDFGRYIPELQIYALMNQFVSSIITSPLFNFIFKTPLVITDALVGIVLYKFILEITKDSKKAKVGFLIWFFNPFVFMVNAVHGAFDVIPTFFTLLSIILVYKEKYFWAGSLLMFGILSKLYPVFFVPLLIGYILSIVYHNKTSKVDRIKNLARRYLALLSGAGFSTIIVTLPIILQGKLLNATSSIFTRTETGFPVGGISPWFISKIPGYNWIFLWAYKNPGPVLQYSEISAIIALGFLGVLVFLFSYKNPVKWLFFGSVASLSITYLTSSLVNPQYLIWIMPFLIISYSLFQNSYKYIITVLSTIGIGYYYSLQGFWNMVLPLAVFTKIIGLDSIFRGSQIFWTTPGFMNVYYRDDLILLMGLIGTGAIILSLFPNGISFRRKLLQIINKRRE
jgi:Gpi18-like mannosyltransferase